MEYRSGLQGLYRLIREFLPSLPMWLASKATLDDAGQSGDLERALPKSDDLWFSPKREVIAGSVALRNGLIFYEASAARQMESRLHPK